MVAEPFHQGACLYAENRRDRAPKLPGKGLSIMKFPSIPVTVLAALFASMAVAGDDCHVSRDAWQSREAAIQAATDLGWRVEKIEADDGCWEIKGLDARSRRIKAKLDPATLKVVKLRLRDGDDDHDRDRERYSDPPPAADPASKPANPLFQNGAPPVVRVN